MLAQAFNEQDDLPGVLLFDDDQFHSMISRSRYFEIMNIPYSKELFYQRKIKKLASQFESPATIYPLGTYIGKAVEEALERDERDLSEPIVVSDNGSYYIIDTHVLLRSHALIFAKTIKILKAEISQSKVLRERLEVARKEAEKMARLDGLTGIPNRRHMDEYLANEWQRAMRDGTVIAIILLDIDFFKGFNDTHGHQAGDDALQQVAKCLSEQVQRPADMVARYGGEEFIAILPDTSIEGAFALAEKMRLAVRNLRIENKHSCIDNYLSISCGLSCSDFLKNKEVDQIIEFADQALYQAKSHGRNRVMIASHHPQRLLFHAHKDVLPSSYYS